MQNNNTSDVRCVRFWTRRLLGMPAEWQAEFRESFASNFSTLMREPILTVACLLCLPTARVIEIQREREVRAFLHCVWW